MFFKPSTTFYNKNKKFNYYNVYYSQEREKQRDDGSRTRKVNIIIYATLHHIQRVRTYVVRFDDR